MALLVLLLKFLAAFAGVRCVRLLLERFDDDDDGSGGYRVSFK